MKPQTFGRSYDAGKIVSVQCIKGDTLKDLDIKDSCFLLVIIYEGMACFRVREASFDAIGPCLVCFDETVSPVLVRKRGLKCDSVYFNPSFLNVNMTFSRIHNDNYEHIADAHDLFLLKPFTDKDRYVLPIFDEYMDNIKRLFLQMHNELNIQTDWYWSCRSRSYFMEMMLLLERTHGFVEQNNMLDVVDRVQNPHLKKALLFIESNYSESITLENIVKSASLNHSSLTRLFKNELNMTPIEYLWDHRLLVAKRLLEFTNLYVKEIAKRCGFKTTQHFSRKFEEKFKINPSTFRIDAVEKRKMNL